MSEDAWKLRVESKLDDLSDQLKILTGIEAHQTHILEQMATINKRLAKHDNDIEQLKLTDASRGPLHALGEKIVTHIMTAGIGAAILWAFMELK